MVIVGDFKVELVDATTLKPFLEHSKNGQTYVEVEPDVEYWIKFQRISMSSITMEEFAVQCSVDGKSLGWCCNYHGVPKKDFKVHYCGSMSYDGVNQRYEMRRLLFSKLKTTKSALSTAGDVAVDSFHRPMLMGSIKFEISKKGRRLGLIDFPSDSCIFSSEISKSTGTPVVGDGAEKQVRSKVAVKASYTASCSSPEIQKVGDKLQTSVLNYCTTPGLIYAGILPNPTNDDVYKYHRMMIKLTNKSIPPPLVPPQRLCEERNRYNSDGALIGSKRVYWEEFDLTKLDDSDDNSDDVIKYSNPKKKKICRGGGGGGYGDSSSSDETSDRNSDNHSHRSNVLSKNSDQEEMQACRGKDIDIDNDSDSDYVDSDCEMYS